jgi:hypothetical protein
LRYTEKSIETVFEKIVFSDETLDEFYRDYLSHEYPNGICIDRIYYYDIARISDYIKIMLLNGQTNNFTLLFNNIEEILRNSDHFVSELIVIGLLEDLQNKTNTNYTAYNKWLQPESKKQWNNLIKFWEGSKKNL